MIPPRRNNIVEIPIHWTTEQADAIFEFLGQLSNAVWDAYDHELTKIAQAQITASKLTDSQTNDDSDDSDLPF